MSTTCLRILTAVSLALCLALAFASSSSIESFGTHAIFWLRIDPAYADTATLPEDGIFTGPTGDPTGGGGTPVDPQPTDDDKDTTIDGQLPETSTCSSDTPRQCTTKSDGTEYCACCPASEALTCRTTSGGEQCGCAKCLYPTRIAQTADADKTLRGSEEIFSGPASSSLTCLNQLCRRFGTCVMVRHDHDDDHLRDYLLDFPNYVPVGSLAYRNFDANLPALEGAVNGNGGKARHQGFELMGMVFLDDDCHPASLTGLYRVCGHVDARFIKSPISFLWNDHVAITDRLGYAQFPLNPTSPGKWYAWRASSDTPLLVFDPKHDGVITSASQVFGAWTFGGKRTASLGDAAKSTPWKDGYEALGTLDANRDGKLSGGELADLALWFDSNQNGISEPGEVKTLADVQVMNVYFKPDSVDPVTQNIHASVGFDRLLNGSLVHGASVDWFSKDYNSKIEAEFGERPLEILSQSQSEAGAKHKPSASGSSPFQGMWLWKSDRAFGGMTAAGVLSFKPGAQSFQGHSVMEVPLTRNADGPRKAMLAMPLRGARTSTNTIRFEVTGENGQPTKSEAYLSADGKTLIGRSSTVLEKDVKTGLEQTYDYSWTAERMQR
ncbi:MAG: hypothetical protein U0136_18100 [Bdellovibrionota bacterium]